MGGVMVCVSFGPGTGHFEYTLVVQPILGEEFVPKINRHLMGIV
ncbi:hypothetical protein BSU04_14665 [Caballeronia sordidicola]|uniref:Uncharacterized protein n=1 Tax=Caballeronia sordidicola TaxID=196367 RepID=A0A226X419_CABSO|nr:hypothetical protein BSU04_14665 [Caballeronia sordidicola]